MVEAGIPQIMHAKEISKSGTAPAIWQRPHDRKSQSRVGGKASLGIEPGSRSKIPGHSMGSWEVSICRVGMRLDGSVLILALPLPPSCLCTALPAM